MLWVCRRGKTNRSVNQTLILVRTTRWTLGKVRKVMFTTSQQLQPTLETWSSPISQHRLRLTPSWPTPTIWCPRPRLKTGSATKASVWVTQSMHMRTCRGSKVTITLLAKASTRATRSTTSQIITRSNASLTSTSSNKRSTRCYRLRPFLKESSKPSTITSRTQEK